MDNDTIISQLASFLSCRSHYAPSKAACTISALISRAKELGLKALGLMDDDTIAGCLEFSEKAKKAGIKPINGVRLKVSIPVKILEDDVEQVHVTSGVVGLIALNETGWRNMQWLVGTFHKSYRDGLPIFDLWSNAAVRSKFEGLACLSGSIQADGESGREGLLPHIITLFLDKGPAGARGIAKAAMLLKRVFNGELYIEISRPGMPEKIEEALLQLAVLEDKDGTPLAPLIATPDVRYPAPENHIAWRLIWAKSQGTRVRQQELDNLPAPLQARYLLSQNEMAIYYADIPEALRSLEFLAVRATYAPMPGQPMLPVLRDKKTGEPLDSDKTFRDQSYAGLYQIFGENVGAEYLERLEREINVIIKMGFPSYFLMVADFVNAAKAQGIEVGIGRGSGAGSLVAYCLGITGVDPLQYGLLFERFLNPDRVSMPDFDIDFCAEKREKVFEYLRDTYGEDRTAQIITYMAPKPRGSITMVYQVVIPDGTVADAGSFRRADLLALTRMIPNGQKDISKSLDQLIEEYPEIAQAAAKEPMVAMLFKYALAIKDIYIQTGVHAAGIVLAPAPLVDCMPVIYDVNSEHCICAYAMKYAEMAGFVKFDILSLETLTVIDRTTAWIRKRHNEQFRIQTVPMDDAKVYEAMSKGMSSGSFQFETPLMKKGLMQIMPSRIHDLIALNALSRPGPLEFIPEYAACKAGLKQPEYAAPGTEGILGETYGIMIYQEQIMQIAQKVAGYSLGAADLLRRAMGKKDKVEMDKQRQGFIYGDDQKAIPGCIKLGMAENDAIKLFESIAKFADYGFNKSHAAVYAYLGYWTMWLKVHYAAEFISAQITTKISAGGSPEKRGEAIDNLLNDAKASGLIILPPSINKSLLEFAPEGRRGVRPGFGMLKGISTVKPEFFAVRKEAPFTDLLDFFNRGKAYWNKRQLNALIDVGALDELHPDAIGGKHGPVNRRQIYDLLEWYAKETEKSRKKRDTQSKNKVHGQSGFFGMEEQDDESPSLVPNYIPPDIARLPDQNDRPYRELAAAGLFITSHPVRSAMQDLMCLGVKTYEGIIEYTRRTNDANHAWNICVLIRNYKIRTASLGHSTSIEIHFMSYSCSGIAYFNAPTGRFRDQKNAVSFERIVQELEAAKNSLTPVIMAGRLPERGQQKFVVSSLISAERYRDHAIRNNGWVHVIRDVGPFSSPEDAESIAELLSTTKAGPADPERIQVHIITPLSDFRKGAAVVVSLPDDFDAKNILMLRNQGGVADLSIQVPMPPHLISPPKKIGPSAVPDPLDPNDLAAISEEEDSLTIIDEALEHEYGVEDAPNFLFGSDELDEALPKGSPIQSFIFTDRVNADTSSGLSRDF